MARNPRWIRGKTRLAIVTAVLTLTGGVAAGTGTVAVSAAPSTQAEPAHLANLSYWHYPSRSASRATWDAWSKWEARQMRQALDQHFAVPSGCTVLRSSLLPGRAVGVGAPAGVRDSGGAYLLHCNGDVAHSTVGGTAPRLPLPPNLRASMQSPRTPTPYQNPPNQKTCGNITGPGTDCVGLSFTL